MAKQVLLFCYAITFLLSAALLFSAQPMIAKMVLPVYGGSSAVWTTCMLFFQVTLLAGYGYAYVTTNWFSLQIQLFGHSMILLAPLALLPFALPVDWSPPAARDPSWSLSLLLILVAGAPLFVVSASAPLFQRWFAETTHESARDPYFLYGVSNLGSMVALLSYPLLWEPKFGVSRQAAIWAVGYGVLVFVALCCAGMTWRMRQRRPDVARSEQLKTANRNPASGAVTMRDRMWWVILAFVPSSWMLAVTTRLTTDIAPMPLLWIIPLALYLLTFILVFARRRLIPQVLVAKGLPFALIVLMVSLIASSRWQLLGVHLAVFFVGAMFCHGELAQRRPDFRHLPQYYLWMSLGGTLGGVFNALIAPRVFPVLFEFPLVVTIVSFLQARCERGDNRRWREESRWADLACLVVTTLLIGVFVRGYNLHANLLVVSLVAVGAPVLFILHFIHQPNWFATVLAVVMMSAEFHATTGGAVLTTARSFYGVHRVVLDTNPEPPHFRRLFHGTTQHGFQDANPTRACDPLAYYHRRGPLGDVMSLYRASNNEQQQIAVIGLGTGATVCYATPNRYFTFYEIDPVVKHLAESPEFFSYLRNCAAGQYRVIVGDGRRMISTAPDAAYDIIMLDAFSSDAVPTHLITREAIAIYLSKLNADGLLVFHISNNHLDLSLVLRDLASDLRLAALLCEDLYHNDADLIDGKTPSTYVVMARREADLGRLSGLGRWYPMGIPSYTRPWTDDYSNIISVLKWQQQRKAPASH